MSRSRILIAAALAVAVAALMGWQYRRTRLIEACLADAGVWNGKACVPDTRRIILQRDLHRS